METHPNSIVQLEENARGGRLTTPLGNSKVPILTAVKSFVLDSSCHFSAGSTSDVHLRCTQTSTPHSPQCDERHVTHTSATSPALHVTWHWALFTPLTFWHTMSRGEKREGSKRERESERGGRKGSFVKWFHWRRVSTADSSEIRFLIGETKFSLQQICCNASGKEFLLGFCERVFPKMGFVVGTCGLGLGLVN